MLLFILSFRLIICNVFRLVNNIFNLTFQIGSSLCLSNLLSQTWSHVTILSVLSGSWRRDNIFRLRADFQWYSASSPLKLCVVVYRNILLNRDLRFHGFHGVLSSLVSFMYIYNTILFDRAFVVRQLFGRALFLLLRRSNINLTCRRNCRSRFILSLHSTFVMLAAFLNHSNWLLRRFWKLVLLGSVHVWMLWVHQLQIWSIPLVAYLARCHLFLER